MAAMRQSWRRLETRHYKEETEETARERKGRSMLRPYKGTRGLAGGAFAEEAGFTNWRGGRGLSGGRAGATKLLELQDGVGEKYGEYEASPDHGFDGGRP